METPILILPTELLETLTMRLDGSDVMRLYMTGDSRMIKKLLSPGAVRQLIFVEPDHRKDLCLPTLVSSFPSLETIDLERCDAHCTCSYWTLGISWIQLPRTLKRIFNLWPRDGCSLVSHNAKDLFPQLESLTLLMSSPYSRVLSLELFLPTLPSSITRLDLSYEVLDFAALHLVPRTVTDLSIAFSLSSRPEVFPWPPNLESLVAHAFPSVVVYQQLPDTLTVLEAYVNEGIPDFLEGETVEDIKRVISLWPKGLKTLNFTITQNHSSILSVLPPSIKHLCIDCLTSNRINSKWDPSALQLLPNTIEHLFIDVELGSGAHSPSEAMYIIGSLPKSLKQLVSPLHTLLSHKGVLPLLPSSLTQLEIPKLLEGHLSLLPKTLEKLSVVSQIKCSAEERFPPSLVSLKAGTLYLSALTSLLHSIVPHLVFISVGSSTASAQLAVIGYFPTSLTELRILSTNDSKLDASVCDRLRKFHRLDTLHLNCKEPSLVLDLVQHLPISLTSLHIASIGILPTSVLFSLGHLNQLQSLHLASVDYNLTDEHIKALPRTLRSCHITTSDTAHKLTESLYSKIPPRLHTLKMILKPAIYVSQLKPPSLHVCSSPQSSWYWN